MYYLPLCTWHYPKLQSFILPRSCFELFAGFLLLITPSITSFNLSYSRSNNNDAWVDELLRETSLHNHPVRLHRDTTISNDVYCQSSEVTISSFMVFCIQYRSQVTAIQNRANSATGPTESVVYCESIALQIILGTYRTLDTLNIKLRLFLFTIMVDAGLCSTLLY